MSNVQDVRKTKVKVMLDKERTLFYDLNAFAELEEAYGSVDAAMKIMEEGSVTGIRLLLWAGLIHEELDENDEPKISPKKVGSWLDLGGVTEISKKITEALTGATPKTIDEAINAQAELAQQKAAGTVPLVKAPVQTK